MSKSWKMGANGMQEYTEDAPTAVASTNVGTNTTTPTTSTPAPTPVSTPTPTAPTPTPSPVVTSTQARNAEVDNAKGYIQYAGSPDVFEKGTNRYITYAEASAKNIWGNIQQSTEARPAEVKTDMENIQTVFGSDWKPAPSITPELQAKGIYGAVKIGNQVYTIGSGGHPVGNDEFKQLFGTDDQNGIVGQVDIAQATALGITPTQDDISVFDENQRAKLYNVTSLADLSKKQEDIQKEVNKVGDEWMKKINDSVADLIKVEKDFGKTKAAEKDAEATKLGLDEKDAAIVKAQTTYSEHKNLYDVYIKGLLSKGGLTTSDIGNMTAQANAQKAIELAPLEAAIKIAEGSYDRAKTMLDEWSDDYDTNYTHLLSAYQMNIDNMGTNLTYEQGKAKDQATQKLALLQASYDEMKENQEAVKTLMLMPSLARAGITINDSWQTAYEKASPYIISNAALEKEMAMLDVELKKAQVQTEYAQAGAAGRSNRGSSSGSAEKEVKLTGLAGALDEAAKDVIAAENAGAPMSSESYWNMVKQFSEVTGVTEADADKQIINTVKAKKGEAINANTNMGSDFVEETDIMKSIASKPAVFTTTAQQAKNTQNSYAEELKQKANTLIATYRNSPYSPEGIKAKNQLNSIPRTYMGITIHSGV